MQKRNAQFSSRNIYSAVILYRATTFISYLLVDVNSAAFCDVEHNAQVKPAGVGGQAQGGIIATLSP